MAEQYRWSGDQSRQITKRIVVEGELVLQTPAHFGNGVSDGTEMLILEDALDKRPLLPGASIAGALRHYLLMREYGYRMPEVQNSLAVVLFGEAYENDRGTQSRVTIDDALATQHDHLLESRDGVKICGKTRTAEDGALYTFQVWSAGTRFKLRFELCLYEGDAEWEVDLIRAFATALNGLSNGSIPLGARKHRGFGRGQGENWRAHIYDLSTTYGLVDWVANGGNPLSDPIYDWPSYALNVDEIDDARQFVRVDATFMLNDSLLIRAGSDVSDMAHLHDTRLTGIPRPILSGTSLAGALRARALKIAHTLRIRECDDLVNDMFGMFGADADQDPDKRSASRILVEEHAIKDGAFEYVQNRVKIDRFTGGAFDTGLFGQQPVFATDQTTVRVCLELRYPSEQDPQPIDVQTGLLFLLLKDLWTGDLPLGGESSVGRGRLYGQSAVITICNQHHNQNINLVQDQSGLSIDAPEVLESYVQSFLAEREQ